MAAQRHRDGEKRTCPHCGQASTFSSRTRIDRPDSMSTSGQSPAADYKPGWTCENKNCSQRHDFNV